MKTFRIITTLIMSVGFGFFSVAKIVGASVVTESQGWNRLSEGQWATIGALEIAAVVGLLLALHPRFRALGVAAATGLATLCLCAVVYHVINADPAGDIFPAVLQGLVATSYAVLGARSLRQTEAPVSGVGFATA